MKLYVVHLAGVRQFLEVRDVAKKVDPYCIVNVRDGGRSFEFQSKLAADEVARVFDGKLDVIEYDIRDLIK